MAVRTISWFSCGAPSAVATMFSKPDIVAYCETGSEHSDNKRFMAECEKWFGQDVIRLRSKKYKDTWEVWEDRKYLAGIEGAPCTGELKIKPRLAFQEPDDIHIFGYTADADDIRRTEALQENWPDLKVKFPLIESGLTKAACLDLCLRMGIKPPVTYDMGLPNANCLPCVKATSPRYWALIRQEFPDIFERMVEISRRLDVRLCRLDGERSFIDEIPESFPTTNAIAPECDILCALAEQELTA